MGSYYKIRLKPIRGEKRTWMDDYNTPDPKNKDRTRRYKTFPAAIKAFYRTTWGIPHIKKIVKVTPSGTKTVFTSNMVFPRGAGKVKVEKAKPKPSKKKTRKRRVRTTSLERLMKQSLGW